jgi:hypothetical protein
MVWDGLEIAIEWVEGVRCEWSGNDPFVVWLVETLVDSGPVQPSVDKVDA